MGVETAFRRVASALDELRDGGVRISEVATPDQRVGDDGTFVASVTAEFDAFDPDALGQAVRVTASDGARIDGGTVRFDLKLTVDLAGDRATVAWDDESAPAAVDEAATGAESGAEERDAPTEDDGNDGTGASEETGGEVGADARSAAESDAAGESDADRQAEIDRTKSDRSKTNRTKAERPKTDGRLDADERPHAVGNSTADGGTVAVGDAVAGGSSDAVEAPDAAGENDDPDATRGVDDSVPAGEDRDADASRDGDCSGTVSDGNGGDGDRPPHRDPERLREAYEEHDTFAEMTNALGVDVTSQTVRHHMIKHGIHEPRTNDSTHVAAASRARIDAAADSADEDSSANEDSPADEVSSATDEVSSDSDANGEVPPEGDRNEAPAVVGSDDTESTTDSPTDESDETSLIDESDGDGTTEDGSAESGSVEDETTERGTAAEIAEGADPAEADASSEPTDAPIGDDVDLAEIDLPSHLTLERIRDAVCDSDTLYQAQQRLKVDGETATRLLRELKLLDFVTGRIATKPDREVTVDEIDERIRAAATAVGPAGQRESGDA